MEYISGAWLSWPDEKCYQSKLLGIHFQPALVACSWMLGFWSCSASGPLQGASGMPLLKEKPQLRSPFPSLIQWGENAPDQNPLLICLEWTYHTEHQQNPVSITIGIEIYQEKHKLCIEMRWMDRKLKQEDLDNVQSHKINIVDRPTHLHQRISNHVTSINPNHHYCCR